MHAGKYDWPHVLITVVILLGCGYLLKTEPTMRGELMMLLSGVTGFWFGSKSGNGNGNGSGKALGSGNGGAP